MRIKLYRCQKLIIFLPLYFLLKYILHVRWHVSVTLNAEKLFYHNIDYMDTTSRTVKHFKNMFLFPQFALVFWKGQVSQPGSVSFLCSNLTQSFVRFLGEMGYHIYNSFVNDRIKV